jgi:HPt (histidine-containing phosphotransfer) domain-containing protein
LLHRLAGSGSTFGFDALGRRARALEQALLTSEDGPRAVPLATVRAELAAAEAELRDHALPRSDPALAAVKRASPQGGPGRRRR